MNEKRENAKTKGNEGKLDEGNCQVFVRRVSRKFVVHFYVLSSGKIKENEGYEDYLRSRGDNSLMLPPEDNKSFISKLNHRQKYLFRENKKAITKSDLEEIIAPLAMSIRNLEGTTSGIISKGATKVDITAAIRNLLITQQITQSQKQRQLVQFLNGME